MKTVMNYINEAGRGRPRKNPLPGLKEIEGKDAKNNGTDGKYEFNPKTDDEAIEEDDIDLNSPDNTESLEDLIDKFDAEEPFFIEGRAGWGKTSIIKKLAKKYGYEIVVMYLDKIEATDLGGMPITIKDEKGRPQTVYSMPAFAKDMLESMNKKDGKKYLLFFDEMNQAMPDVMNALMPIVLENEIAQVKFDNFFVGSAGNLEEENKGGLSELSGPLKSRFKPIIKWESGTPAAWKQAFGHMRRKYGKRVGEDIINALDDAHELFDNPREITMKIIEFIEKIRKNPDAISRAKSQKTKRRLMALIDKDPSALTLSQTNKIDKLAETITKFIKGEDTSASGAKRSKKDMNQINKELIQVMKQALERGFFKQGDVKYGISRENIGMFIDDKEANAEMVQIILDKFDADGVKAKYATDEGWKKAGLADPNDCPDPEDED